MARAIPGPMARLRAFLCGVEMPDAHAVSAGVESLRELSRILVLLARRAGGDWHRLMTARMSEQLACFECDAFQPVGEDVELVILLYPGCSVRARGVVEACEARRGGCAGRLRFEIAEADRGMLRSFLGKAWGPRAA